MIEIPLVSIIVPVYNAEKYIDRCIQSVLCQSFSSWELLLVDDGSTDNSGAICDEYAFKDDRIKVLHKENGGVSSARNDGIRQSCGTWLTFIDIDDYVQDSFLEILVKEADKADLVVSGVHYVNDKISFLPPDRLVDISDDLPFLDEQLCSIYLMTCWAKLFKRSFVIGKEIYFNSSLRIGEDTDFVLQYMMCIKSIRFIHTSSYNYNDEENLKLFKYSLNAENFELHLSFILENLNRLRNKYRYSFSCFEQMLNEYYSRLFFIYLLGIRNYSDFYTEHKLYIGGKIRYRPDSFKKKILFLFFVYFPYISFLFIRLLKK